MVEGMIQETRDEKETSEYTQGRLDTLEEIRQTVLAVMFGKPIPENGKGGSSLVGRSSL